MFGTECDMDMVDILIILEKQVLWTPNCAIEMPLWCCSLFGSIVG